MKLNFFTLTVAFLFLGTSCTERNKQEELNYFKLSGFTQGTTFHITYGVADSVNYAEQVDSVLADFDMSLSTYIPESRISRINTNETDSIDAKIEATFTIAEEVNRISGGAFDITVMPLVNAWGFGPGTKVDLDEEKVDSLLEFVGMDKISIHDGRIIKQDPRVTLDVNAIAQGYSVDVVASFFESRGIDNYMVEIGGELKTRGKSPRGDAWKVGVDKPVEGNIIPGANLQAILQLENKALATSGNYRKFYEENGVKYTHSIDPKSGYPSRQSILSVTIIADEGITADAYATACMILGVEKSKEMLGQLDDVDAYIIYNDEEGKYEVWHTKGMREMIVEEKEAE